MRRIIEYPLEDGGTVKVEVGESDLDGRPVRGVRTGEIVEKAQQSFEATLALLQPSTDAIIGKLRSLSARPDEVEVKFGLKLTATAGALIAAAATEAQFEIRLTWKQGQSNE